MTRRVLILAVVHAGITAVLGAAGHWEPLAVPPLRTAAFAVAFAVVGLFPMHLEFRRHACTVTLVDAVLIASLFLLPPAGVVLAAATGELLACIAQGQRSLKLLFNTVATAGSVTVAAGVFGVLSPGGVLEPSAWLPALAAVAVYAIASHVSTSAVLAVVEAKSFHALFLASAATASVATVVSASLGLSVLALVALHPMAPLLIVPPLGAAWLATARLAAQQADHLRFQRLYEASSRTAGLQGLDGVLASLAAEARTLATGAVAICCAPQVDGAWRGVVVDDHGYHAAPDDLVRELRALAGRGNVEVSEAELTLPLRRALPTLRSVVVAATPAGSGHPAVLAVGREMDPDGMSATRATVLAAFAGHAGLAAANARLFEEVEEALRHQLDLNRQKDDFVATVSHELRTPLTSMLGAVTTIRRIDGRLSPDKREQLLEVAQRQGHRLQRLIEDLLLVAATDAGGAAARMEDVPLAAFLADLAEELAPAAPQLTLRPTPEGLAVRTDSGKVRQILTNLVENAVKYAPGSPVEVGASVAGEPGAVVVAVTDHGPGIPEGDRERAFERFVQLDQSSTRSQGGTGLGLYLCRQLAEAVGGRLTLSEAPGGGCRFELVLPGGLVDLAGQPNRAIAGSAAAVHHRGAPQPVVMAHRSETA